MKKLPIALGAAALALAASQAMAANMSPQDKEFATRAASSGMAEVSMGALAQRNANSAQVKQFGERMVTDHTKANAELKAVAQQQHLTLPNAIDPTDQAAEQRLSSTKGQAFDTAYMRNQVADHQQDIALFRREAQSGQDPALKNFAEKTLPILQEHLQLAEQAASSQK
ncbi:MAG TPA: DUF4142 domain-containing protein [Rhodopila sp.]|nr:DUF4142 domain-containing protein [Rhodopila sp.]